MNMNDYKATLLKFIISHKSLWHNSNIIDINIYTTS